jgi:hypothetical protein
MPESAIYVFIVVNTTCHIIKTVWIKVKRQTLNKRENYDFMRSLLLPTDDLCYRPLNSFKQ